MFQRDTISFNFPSDSLFLNLDADVYIIMTNKNGKLGVRFVLWLIYYSILVNLKNKLAEWGAEGTKYG